MEETFRLLPNLKCFDKPLQTVTQQDGGACAKINKEHWVAYLKLTVFDCLSPLKTFFSTVTIVTEKRNYILI